MPARKRLQVAGNPVPEADPAAVARMKCGTGKSHQARNAAQAHGFLRRGPDISTAAKTGQPTMTNPKAVDSGHGSRRGRRTGRDRRDGGAGNGSDRARYQAGCPRQSAGRSGVTQAGAHISTPRDT